MSADARHGLLVASTYPPERCGVAAYAAQSVRALREQGETVAVLTWGEGTGDIRLPHWPRGRRCLALLPHLSAAPRALLHYMPAFYIDDSGRVGQLLSRLALWRVFRACPRLEVLVHEQSWYPDPGELSVPGRVLWRLERRMWQAAARLTFHNAAAVATCRSRFRIEVPHAQIVAHGRDFAPSYTGDRTAARAELGVEADGLLLVSPGFVTPYKGYETALEALAMVPRLPCRYVVVGSLHPRAGEADLGYLSFLRERAAADPRVEVREEYVDDAAFDRWIRAADAVLLPYRSSTSSSVLARCRLLGTPALVSKAAGLRAEMGPGDRCAGGPAELAAALEALASGVAGRTG
jgi:glycosyltransferase involved in cell wall biosynthesis